MSLVNALNTEQNIESGQPKIFSIYQDNLGTQTPQPLIEKPILPVSINNQSKI